MPENKWYSQVPTQELEAELKPYGDDDEIGTTYVEAQGRDTRYFLVLFH